MPRHGPAFPRRDLEAAYRHGTGRQDKEARLTVKPTFLLITLLSALFISAEMARAESPKLNLLYITADDMNADSPGWMGSKMAVSGAIPSTTEITLPKSNASPRCCSRT